MKRPKNKALPANLDVILAARSLLTIAFVKASVEEQMNSFAAGSEIVSGSDNGGYVAVNAQQEEAVAIKNATIKETGAVSAALA